MEEVAAGLRDGDRRLHCVVCLADLRRTMGGSSRSVPQLCEALARMDVRTTLVGPIEEFDDYVVPDASVGFIDSASLPGLRSAQVAVEAALKSNPQDRVVIHDNQIWRPFHHHVMKAARARGVPVLLSPRGTMTPWAMSYKLYKKQLAWLLYQRRIVSEVSAFHATSQLEASGIRDLGFRQPIAIVPNGIDFPTALPRPKAVAERRTMLFLSRIHPKKGLLNLVRAWRASNPGDAWRLVIAGPDEAGHETEIKALVGTLGLQDQVEFPGEISDKDKWSIYEAADVFVLPSFSENFGLVIAEALAAATPVIATTGTPWSALRENCLGWWVEPSVESLVPAIREATSMPPERLYAMGAKASPWARKEFSWDAVAAQMKTLYAWLADGGEAPPFVQQCDRPSSGPRRWLGPRPAFGV